MAHVLTPKGKLFLDRVKLSTPVVGDLFHKLYLSRISDNMDTMLSSGIAIVRSIEITGSVVGNSIYENIMKEAAEAVKEGRSLSQSFESHPEVPSILVQMIRVGEETGSLAQILRTLAHFYKREVDDAVDTMVGLIEPIMIVLLGLGVGVLSHQYLYRSTISPVVLNKKNIHRDIHSNAWTTCVL